MATDPIAPEEQEELEEQPVSKRYRFNPDTLRNLETQQPNRTSTGRQSI